VLNSKVSKAKDGLLASHKISKTMAKAGKPHSIGGRVILPSLYLVISSVMKQNANVVINFIPLKCLCIENFEYIFIAKIETSVFPMHEYDIIFVLTGEKGVEISACFETLGAKFDSHCVMS